MSTGKGKSSGRTFDPGAAALADSGIFGLPHSEDEAKVVVVAVPFDATTSYRRGAALGPGAILGASRQVDLFDRDVGRPYEAGIHLREALTELDRWNDEARAAADPIVARGGIDGASDGERSELEAKLSLVNRLSERVNDYVYSTTSELLARDKIVVTLGGDHAVPFGAIRAYAERYPELGILHIDAHADLRLAYEGFTYSHASILRNVADRIGAVSRIVQVGIRDFSEDELSYSESSAGRIRTHFDADAFAAKAMGTPFAELAAAYVDALPDHVYVTFDIDGLDPSLCPHTGTPVPGGLSFHEASYLVGEVVRSGRRIVGADLNEVAPGPDGDEWDANVGARVLYKLIGWMLRSRSA
jgi:agmatinase